MFCPSCGTQNEDGARFCYKCGAMLPEPFQPATGSHLDSDGNGVPDVLEAPTVVAPGHQAAGTASAEPAVLIPNQAKTTVMAAAPTTVMASPEPASELDRTRVAPHPARQQTAYPYAPQPAPAPAPQPAPKKRGRAILIALLAIALVACAGVGFVSWRSYQAEREAAEQARQEAERQEAERQEAERQAAELAEKREPHAVVLPLSASGLDSQGSRIAVRVTGADFEGNDFDMAFYVGADGSGISAPKGSYEVTVLASPIAADGTLYQIPNGTFPFEIPENQKNGSTFNAPGTLVLSALDPASVPEGTLEQALVYATADPQIGDSAAGLAAKAQEKIDAAAAAAAEAQREDAIREAQSLGRSVLQGTVHVLNGRELAEMQNADPDQLFGSEWAKVEEENTYIIVVLDHETALDCQSSDGSGIRTGTATMVSLTKQDPSYWSEREGQSVTIAISPDETWWPSDVSLPLGQPRTAFVQVID